MTAAFAALALLLAADPGPRVLTLDGPASVVRFHVNHKLHRVDGVSRAAEGKAVLDPDGGVKVMVRIPVQSFDTGDANRDSHMLETLEPGRFPHVTFKGIGRLAQPPAAGAPQPLTLRGELDFHGVKQALEVPVTVTFAADGSARATGRLVVSLDAHRVERPSLLLVKLDDECAVDLELALGGAR